MPLPPNIVEYSLVICEKVLHEQDGVLTAVRIVDLFFVDPHPELPAERRAVKVSVIFRVRIADDQEHKVRLSLLRPSGTTAEIAETPPSRAESRYAGLAATIAGVAEVGVLTREMGTHYFVLSCDDTEVGRAAFTLRIRDEAKPDDAPTP